MAAAECEKCFRHGTGLPCKSVCREIIVALELDTPPTNSDLRSDNSRRYILTNDDCNPSTDLSLVQEGSALVLGRHSDKRGNVILPTSVIMSTAGLVELD